MKKYLALASLLLAFCQPSFAASPGYCVPMNPCIQPCPTGCAAPITVPVCEPCAPIVRQVAVPVPVCAPAPCAPVCNPCNPCATGLAAPIYAPPAAPIVVPVERKGFWSRFWGID